MGVGTLSLESRFLVRASRRSFWFIMQNSWWFSFHKKVSLSKHIHAQIQQQKQWKKVWNSLKLTIRTPEQYFEPISSVSVINSEEKFTPFSSVCIVEFEQVNVYWVIRQIFCTKSLVSFWLQRPDFKKQWFNVKNYCKNLEVKTLWYDFFRIMG